MSTREEGNEALGRDEYELAVAIYTKALENTPDDEKLFSNRSLAFYRMNKFDDAVRDAEKVVELKPDWEKGYIRKALAIEKAGSSLDAVVEVYETGLVAIPDSTTFCRAIAGIKSRLSASSDENTTAKKNQSGTTISGGKRCTWNEEQLAKHEAEQGVLYGTMKVDHPDTPFLVYDPEMDKKNLIGTLDHKDAAPNFVNIDDLKGKLGLLEVRQEQGQELVADKTKTPFEQKRTEIYQEEGAVFAKNMAIEKDA